MQQEQASTQAAPAASPCAPGPSAQAATPASTAYTATTANTPAHALATVPVTANPEAVVGEVGNACDVAPGRASGFADTGTVAVA